MTVETTLVLQHTARGVLALGALGSHMSHVVDALPVLFLIAFGVALWRTLFPRTQR